MHPATRSPIALAPAPPVATATASPTVDGVATSGSARTGARAPAFATAALVASTFARPGLTRSLLGAVAIPLAAPGAVASASAVAATRIATPASAASPTRVAVTVATLRALGLPSTLALGLVQLPVAVRVELLDALLAVLVAPRAAFVACECR